MSRNKVYTQPSPTPRGDRSTLPKSCHGVKHLSNETKSGKGQISPKAAEKVREHDAIRHRDNITCTATNLKTINAHRNYHAGTRTRVYPVRAGYPNHLDYMEDMHAEQFLVIRNQSR